MRSDQIESRAVAKIVVVTLFYAALALLLAIVVLHTTTTLRWVVTAVFLALALDPAVALIERIRIGGRNVPRVVATLAVLVAFLAGLVFLILHVVPPAIKEIEGLAKKLPTYVADFEHWADDNRQFQELNDKYDLTSKLSEQASSLPSKLGSGASELGSVTVSLLEHLIAAITVLTITVFLLLEGKGMFERGTGRLPPPQRERTRHVGTRIAAVVRSYVSVNLLLAVASGLFTWIFLEILGFHLAIPLAVLVGFLDLIPLVGLTVGGLLVAIVLAIDGQPYDALVWLAIFITYQQLQDRVIQPLMYRGGALKVNPVVAIVAVIVGANLAGVLGALIAIPVAASLGVLIDELVLSGPPSAAEPEPAE
ncbi:MAG: AI-2E family transporter [Actinomycetota bacterium]|nr:AI-2E family transporter [Actinomycetota bacterium]